MKKIVSMGMSLIFGGLSCGASAVGFTPWVKITSIGQYGVDQMIVTTDVDVSQCGDKKKLYWLTTDASQPGSFYSTLFDCVYGGKERKNLFA